MNSIHLINGPEGNVSFVFLSFLRLGKHQDSGKQNLLVSRGTVHEVICYIFRLSRKQSCRQKHAVIFSAQATTALLYPGLDTLVFDNGTLTKNQEISVLVLSSESIFKNSTSSMVEY